MDLGALERAVFTESLQDLVIREAIAETDSSLASWTGHKWRWHWGEWQGLPVTIKVIPWASFDRPHWSHRRDELRDLYDLPPASAAPSDTDGSASYEALLQRILCLRSHPHPGILTVYGAIRTDDAVHVIMEHPQLYSRAFALGMHPMQRPYPPHNVLEWGLQLVSAIGFLQKYAAVVGSAFGALSPLSVSVLAPSISGKPWVKLDPLPQIAFLACAPLPHELPKSLWPFCAPESLATLSIGSALPAATDTYALAALLRCLIAPDSVPISSFPRLVFPIEPEATTDLGAQYPTLREYLAAKPWSTPWAPKDRRLASLTRIVTAALSAEPSRRPPLSEIAAVLKQSLIIPESAFLLEHPVNEAGYNPPLSQPTEVSPVEGEAIQIHDSPNPTPQQRDGRPAIESDFKYAPANPKDSPLYGNFKDVLKPDSIASSMGNPVESVLAPHLVRHGQEARKEAAEASPPESNDIYVLYNQLLQHYASAPKNAALGYYDQCVVLIRNIYRMDPTFLPLWITFQHISDERPKLFSNSEFGPILKKKYEYPKTISSDKLRFWESYIVTLFEDNRLQTTTSPVAILKVLVYSSFYLAYIKNHQLALSSLIHITSNQSGQPEISSAYFVYGYCILAGNSEEGATVEQGSGFLKKAALMGHAYAQYKYGQSCEAGIGVRKSTSEAFHWYKQAAENGDKSGQFNLAKMYLQGTGCPVNLQEAYKWMKVSAEQGHPSAIAVVEKLQEGQNVHAKVVHREQHACGNPNCKYQHGGRTDSKITDEVLQSMRKIADEDEDPETMVAVGKNYLYARGVPQSKQKAFEIFIKAAESDNISAKYYVAICHEHGHGTQKNVKKAIDIYRECAEKGHDGSQYRLAYHLCFGAYIQSNLGESARYLLLAANQNHREAQFRLARFYISGTGVERSREKSFFWMRCSADGDTLEAIFELGIYYLEGTGTEVNYPLGLKYLKTAAKYGHAEATELYSRYEGKSPSGFAASPPAGRKVQNRKFEVIEGDDDVDDDDDDDEGREDMKGGPVRRKVGADDEEESDTKSFGDEKKTPVKSKHERDVLMSTMVTLREQKIAPAEESTGEKAGVSSWSRSNIAEINPMNLIRNTPGAEEQKKYELGMNYLEGTSGYHKNYSSAYDHFLEAAKRGHAPSMCMIGKIWSGGLAKPIDDEVAFRWYEAAAERDETEAIFMLGKYYFTGYASVRSGERSASLLRKAAERNHAGAQRFLAYLYEKGFGVQRNTREYIRWLRASSDNGDLTATYQLGKEMFSGKCVGGRDFVEAFRLFEKGARAGNILSMLFMAQCYEKGCGVEKNIQEAKRYFTMADHAGYDAAKKELARLKSQGY